MSPPRLSPHSHHTTHPLSENDYVIHLTVEQFEKMKQNGSFGELEVKWVHGPNREILVTLNTADYETLQSNIFQITAETEAGRD